MQYPKLGEGFTMDYNSILKIREIVRSNFLRPLRNYWSVHCCYLGNYGKEHTAIDCPSEIKRDMLPVWFNNTQTDERLLGVTPHYLLRSFFFTLLSKCQGEQVFFKITAGACTSGSSSVTKPTVNQAKTQELQVTLTFFLAFSYYGRGGLLISKTIHEKHIHTDRQN